MALLRDGKLLTCTVQIGRLSHAYRDPVFSNVHNDQRTVKWNGVTVRELNGELRALYGYPADESGVLVMDANSGPGEPDFKLRRGDS